MSEVVSDATYVAAVREEAAALAAAAGSAGIEAPVPTCPGWTVTDLLDHMGITQAWAAANIAGGGEQERMRNVARRAPETSPLEWFRTQAEHLADVMERVDPDGPAWTWAGEELPARWWFRRMAHETTVHRVDAQASAGMDSSPVAVPLAVDAVDEFLTVFGPLGYDRERWGTGQTVHLHCTDADGEWLVHLDPGGLSVERVHAKGDVAARGPAWDLLLTGWGRPAGGPLQIFGDAELLERFWHTVRI